MMILSGCISLYVRASSSLILPAVKDTNLFSLTDTYADTAAALAAEKAIRDAEAEIIATNDTAAIADFRKAVVDSRQRHAPYLTAIKVKNGVSNEKAVEEVTKDVLNGDVSVRALAASMDSALKVNSNE